MLADEAQTDYQGGRNILQNRISKVDYSVGDGYVYIKSVTFRVPVNGVSTGLPYYFVKVNVGSSVKVSTDLFFWDNDGLN